MPLHFEAVNANIILRVVHIQHRYSHDIHVATSIISMRTRAEEDATQRRDARDKLEEESSKRRADKTEHTSVNQARQATANKGAQKNEYMWIADDERRPAQRDAPEGEVNQYREHKAEEDKLTREVRKLAMRELAEEDNRAVPS